MLATSPALLLQTGAGTAPECPWGGFAARALCQGTPREPGAAQLVLWGKAWEAKGGEAAAGAALAAFSLCGSRRHSRDREHPEGCQSSCPGVSVCGSSAGASARAGRDTEQSEWP